MSLRTTARHFMRHTYTRTPVLDPAGEETDGYFGDRETPQATIPNLPCLYVHAGTVVRTAFGSAQVVEGRVQVPPTDPLAEGDFVSNVRDAEGVLLLAGPILVSTVRDEATSGVVVARWGVLAGAEPR